MKKQSLKYSVLAVFTFLVFTAELRAQPNPVKWEIKKDPSAQALKLGSRFAISVSAQIEDGWYIYSLTQPRGGPLRTMITVTEGQHFKIAGSIKGPRPLIKFAPGFGINTELHKASVNFLVPLRVRSKLSNGSSELSLEVRYQACTEHICLPPRTVKLECDVVVSGG